MIRISDDSSTESDAGPDSDSHSSPESVLDDDVVILDTVGLPADDRGEARGLAFATFRSGRRARRAAGAALLVRGRAGSRQPFGEQRALDPSPCCAPPPGGSFVHCREWGYGRGGWLVPP